MFDFLVSDTYSCSGSSAHFINLACCKLFKQLHFNIRDVIVLTKTKHQYTMHTSGFFVVVAVVFQLCSYLQGVVHPIPFALARFIFLISRHL